MKCFTVKDFSLLKGLIKFYSIWISGKMKLMNGNFIWVEFTFFDTRMMLDIKKAPDLEA